MAKRYRWKDYLLEKFRNWKKEKVSKSFIFSQFIWQAINFQENRSFDRVQMCFRFYTFQEVCIVREIFKKLFSSFHCALIIFCNESIYEGNTFPFYGSSVIAFSSLKWGSGSDELLFWWWFMRYIDFMIIYAASIYSFLLRISWDGVLSAIYIATSGPINGRIFSRQGYRWRGFSSHLGTMLTKINLMYSVCAKMQDTLRDRVAWLECLW